MPRPIQHPRITSLPVPEPIGAGRLDSFFTEKHGTRLDAVLEYHALVQSMPAELFQRDGKVFEHTQGFFIPRRLRFLGVERLEIFGLYQNLEHLPLEDEARIIVDLLNWQARGDQLYFFMQYGPSTATPELRFYARRAVPERRAGEPIPVTFERDWSSTPPMPPRLVPQPRALYRRFGGDPVTIHLDGKIHHRRLFIGSLEVQAEERPDVHAVLNLGEEPSRWAKDDFSHESDRWQNKGEGSQGMSADEIRAEAGWVIERLRSGQRILVHCAAGMNRSATICCAVLILLEGISAEAALERLRENHPWARPDSHHWLALRWIALQEELRRAQP